MSNKLKSSREVIALRSTSKWLTWMLHAIHRVQTLQHWPFEHKRSSPWRARGSARDQSIGLDSRMITMASKRAQPEINHNDHHNEQEAQSEIYYITQGWSPWWARGLVGDHSKRINGRVAATGRSRRCRSVLIDQDNGCAGPITCWGCDVAVLRPADYCTNLGRGKA